MPDEPKPAPKRERLPDALSAEYHKAHKQVMLWATILFIWELVGVDLGKAKDAGGYIGPIVTALKSPQAVPWVLLALVLYFLFKCSTEWAQCQADRRKMRFARADFISAWIVSLAAIILYVGQTLSRVQFADLLQKNAIGALSFGAGFVVVLPLIQIVDLVLAWKRVSKRGRAWGILIPVLMVVSFILAMWIIAKYKEVPLNWGNVLIGALVGSPLHGAMRFLGLQSSDSLAQFARKLTRLPKN
ncbi:MAG: hypothetical protein ACXW3C_03265 [Pyrinomonadaceae bacterium]